MTGTLWVYKDDGTLQCDRGKEIPLDEMQKELEALGATVLNAEKRTDCRIIIRVCGAPTGQVNAYEVSEDDWEKILIGIVGPMGFRRWMCDTREERVAVTGGEIPWPRSAPIAEMTSAKANPVLVRELIGRYCRVYTQGDALTKDFIPERVNIELTKDNFIADIWYG